MKVFSFLLKLILLCLILFAGFAKAQYCYNFNFHKKEKSLRNIYLPGDSTKHKKNNNGFYFGANLGFYFANSYTAQYYGGSGVNKVDSVINHLYNYQDIKNLVIYDFELGQLPSKMKYSPSLLLGFFAKYNFKNSGIFLQFNFSKLKTNDVFTLKINDPNNYSSDAVYKQESISGSEQRTNIDIGFSHSFNTRKRYKPYIEFGYNINDTKFLESKIKIEGKEYSLVNPYFSYHKIEQSGVGMGAFLGSGVELVFNESISVNPGFNLYWTKIKLGNYNKFKPNYSFFVRIILNGLL